MRPMFVFLSAKISGKVSESTYIAASLIELLHTATLVHDDVVDQANIRRGFFSINAIWKNKIAVLVGDFLLSKGLLLAIENEEFELLKIMSKTVKKMSEGELLQIEKARRLDIDEEIYLNIIRQKTATLIAACCACGAISTTNNNDVVNNLYIFGEMAGIAFQIKDDLFDYTQDSKIGKPTGIDIREQKITLPLIYTLKNSPSKQRKNIINIIKNHNNNSGKVSELINIVKKTGGLIYAKRKMLDYHKKALTILNKFDDSDAKESLKLMIDYVIERKK